MSRLSPEALSHASSRHPWRTIGIWVVVVAMMGYVTSTMLAGVLTTEIAFTNEPESVRAEALLKREFTGSDANTEFLIVRSTSGATVHDEDFKGYVASLTDEVNALGPKVVGDEASNVHEIGDQIDDLILPNDNGILVPVVIRTGADSEGAIPRLRAAVEAVGVQGDGFTAEMIKPAALFARPIGDASHGARKLARGVGKASAGSGKLAAGLRQLAKGAGGLAGGIGGAATGASELASGIDGASGGAHALADGSQQLAAGGSDLAGGLSQLAAAAGSLRQGVRQAGNDARHAASDADHAANGASDGRSDANSIQQLGADIEDDLNDLAAGNPGLAGDPDFQSAMNDAQAVQNQSGNLENRLGGVRDDAASAANQADAAAGANDQVSGGLDQLRSGLRGTAGGAKALARGAGKIGQGTEALADGLGGAATGASQLATGISGAAEGAGGLGEGASGLAVGTAGLREGLGALSAGNRGLANGLGKGAEAMRESEMASGADTETMVVLLKNKGNKPLRDEAFRAYAADSVDALASASNGALDETPVNYFDIKEQSEGLVSDDATATLIPVETADMEAETIHALRGVAEEHAQPGFEVLLAGPGTLQVDTTEVAEADLAKGEQIGILVALLVLIGVFGALIAAFLPIGTAMVAIPVALGMVGLLGQIFEFNLFTANIISMIGLAVGIDYSLFIVARYREERRSGSDKLGSIDRTSGTASRAVLFSGMTVVLALLGMFIIPTTIFRSMASGAILVVLASVAASLTLLPAMLALLGDKINWPRLTKRARQKEAADPDPTGGFWDRATRGVMKRPVVALVASVLVLGTLASFYFTIDKGTTQNASSLPDTVESKQAFNVLSDEFSGGQTDPVQIVVAGKPSEVTDEVAKLETAIQADEAFDDDVTVQAAKSGNAVLVTALLKSDAFTNEAFGGIDRLRADLIPAAFEGSDAQVLVAGSSAFFNDFLSVADDYQSIVFIFVLSLSFILLMMVFRSVVVPLKAVLMNLLSVGAAYGAIVLVFQHGVGVGFFNALGFQFEKVEAIEAWLPADAVLHPVRPVDGLPRVLAVADQGALRPHR